MMRLRPAGEAFSGKSHNMPLSETINLLLNLAERVDHVPA